MGTFITSLYLLAAMITSWLCVLSFRRRDKVAGAYLFVWTLMALVYIVGILVSSNPLTPLSIIDVCSALRIASIAFMPVVMLAFALDRAESGHLTKSALFKAAYVIPVCSLMLLISPWRSLFFSSAPELLPYGLYNTRVVQGPWFMVHTLSCSLLSVVTGVVLVSYWRRSTGFYQRRAALLLIGYVLPTLAMVLTSFGPTNIPKVDYAVLVSPATAACWYVALQRYRLLDVSSIARRHAVELMRDAVIALDPERRITDLNPSALELLRVSRASDALGMPLAGVFSGDALALESVFEVAGAGVTLELEAAAGKRVFDASYTELDAGRQQQVGGILVLRDSTEKARLIEELDAYARTVAHDLKNPLSGLRGYLELIEEDVEELEAAHETLEVVHRAQGITEKMVEIVHELLLMAHMRSGTDLELVELDTASIVGQVKLRLGAQLEGVALEEPEHWPSVMGVAPWVEEVWANYVSNAIKYGGEPPVVTLGVDELEGVARFWVQDNGAGMTAEQAATVFDEFTRLEQHQGVTGHGVGLAVVQRVVERLGGRVGVESVPG